MLSSRSPWHSGLSRNDMPSHTTGRHPYQDGDAGGDGWARPAIKICFPRNIGRTWWKFAHDGGEQLGGEAREDRWLDSSIQAESVRQTSGCTSESRRQLRPQSVRLVDNPPGGTLHGRRARPCVGQHSPSSEEPCRHRIRSPHWFPASHRIMRHGCGGPWQWRSSPVARRVTIPGSVA
jgi:hypothetical protein